MPYNCPLCKLKQVELQFHQKLHRRDFYLCRNCDLSFVDREQLLSFDEEKSRYDLHQNNIRSEGYETFLRRLINPITKNFPNSAKGLDFGSGPFPMLINILNEEGFEHVCSHDPIYSPDPSVFKDKYDFITICEVLEHIYDVGFELERIAKLLTNDAWLVVSTGIKEQVSDLENWHYILDDTHINLFSNKTFEWMAKHYSLNIEKVDKSLVIFSKR